MPTIYDDLLHGLGVDLVSNAGELANGAFVHVASRAHGAALQRRHIGDAVQEHVVLGQHTPAEC